MYSLVYKELYLFMVFEFYAKFTSIPCILHSHSSNTPCFGEQYKLVALQFLNFQHPHSSLSKCSLDNAALKCSIEYRLETSS
jgi:hypothetical protein